jgi:hypothetical protein
MATEDDDTDHPRRSFINSIDLLRTVWRLCIKSSDWWAKENECRDSDGKRERSSEKLGDGAPGNVGKTGGFESKRVMDVDLDSPMEELLDAGFEEDGMVGGRVGGCCLIRRSPERPSPWSCSVTIEDLRTELCQQQIDD